jgi:catechol 2,3-dioxygenase-like lactoylglutathione lyase family enzyme
MNKFACLVLGALIPLATVAKEHPRPKILGIVQVHILTTNQPEANEFYYGIMRALSSTSSSAADCNWCEHAPAAAGGPIEFDLVKGALPKNLISSIAFRTDNAQDLRKIVSKNKIKVGKLTKWPSGATFSVLDPEGHRLIFIQAPDDDQPTLGMPGAYVAPSPAWPHIIHAGFVVKDRAAMDHFYKDILGFHLYWHGGMRDDDTNWVDMQVPDGTDWIEYMLNVPTDADQRTLGVMNHIALGVADMRRADDELLSSKLHLPINETPKIGRDGKWQLNLYDPDETRVELMEFTPVEKPCCSEYTGPHPKP